jgi:arsenate reductase
MAEGWARQLLGGLVHPYSAGTAPQGLDPKAEQVMLEAGVDLSGQASKGLEDLPALEFHAVITLCDRAKESCPVFPGGVIRLHQSFDDPAVLARDALDKASALQPYRRVRDEIREYVRQLPDKLD